MCGMLTIIPACLSCLLDPHFQPCEFLLPDFLHFFLGAIQLLQLLQHDLHVCNLLGDLIKVIDPSIPKICPRRKYRPLRLAQFLIHLL